MAREVRGCPTHPLARRPYSLSYGIRSATEFRDIKSLPLSGLEPKGKTHWSRRHEGRWVPLSLGFGALRRGCRSPKSHGPPERHNNTLKVNGTSVGRSSIRLVLGFQIGGDQVTFALILVSSDRLGEAVALACAERESISAVIGTPPAQPGEKEMTSASMDTAQVALLAASRINGPGASSRSRQVVS